jgi:hypothetical protein
MMRSRVLIVGGGVAGLETLLALRALAGDRVDITILAPELKFVNRRWRSTSRSSPGACGTVPGRAEPDHSRGRAARDLRQPGQRGDPPPPERLGCHVAYEQLRRPERHRMARHCTRRSSPTRGPHRHPAPPDRPTTSRDPRRPRRVHYTEPHGRIAGRDDVFAAGDTTAFPLRPLDGRAVGGRRWRRLAAAGRSAEAPAARTRTNALAPAGRERLVGRDHGAHRRRPGVTCAMGRVRSTTAM